MDPERSDADLLAADGPDAFAQLYQRHATAVLSYFYRRTGSAQTAADLTAETFAAAFGSRRRFRDVGAPGRAWLFRIAHRQLSRFIRTERVGERARRRLGIGPIVLDGTDPERVEELVGFALVARRWRPLWPRCQPALRLRIGHGLAFAEVAAQLGCSERAAQVRVSRALTTLTAQLRPADLP